MSGYYNTCKWWRDVSVNSYCTRQRGHPGEHRSAYGAAWQTEESWNWDGEVEWDPYWLDRVLIPSLQPEERHA